MFAKLKSLFAGLGGSGVSGGNVPPAETVEYKGYRIKPAPYPNNGVYQTVVNDTIQGKTSTFPSSRFAAHAN